MEVSGKVPWLSLMHPLNETLEEPGGLLRLMEGLGQEFKQRGPAEHPGGEEAAVHPWEVLRGGGGASQQCL